MIIDASYGEGGGQILRTALSLSVVKGKKIELKNIRSGRDPSGLANQHLTAVKTLEKICDASVDGATRGSQRLLFDPGYIKGGKYSVDIGTAGSVTLLLHTVLPLAMYSDSNIQLEVEGGTDVRWSPTFDYLKNVTLDLLSSFGMKADLKLKRRGHYPEGGGRVVLNLWPCELESVSPERGSLTKIKGISHCSNLPMHIAERQAKSAKDSLSNYSVEIESKKEEAISKGSSITLWADFEKTIIGGSALGEPGKPAEEVGKEATNDLLSSICTDATVDRYTGDQLIPYLALFGGKYEVPEKTSHLETNAWICEKILDVNINIEGKNPVLVEK